MLTLVKVSTDVSIYVFIQDSRSAIGAGLTGLVYNSSGLVCYYVRPLAASAALTLATQTATGAHSDGGFVEVDATNMPGIYRLDLSDAVCATGVNFVKIMLKGAANMVPVMMDIQLTNFDLNNAANTQTGDSFARLGSPAGASVSVDVAAIKAKVDSMIIKKNTALANFEFLMIDSADHFSPKTGLTVTATRSIDGGAFGACANSVSEVANGVYKISLAAADLNGDVITFKFTATGADQTTLTILTQA